MLHGQFILTLRKALATVRQHSQYCEQVHWIQIPFLLMLRASLSGNLSTTFFRKVCTVCGLYSQSSRLEDLKVTEPSASVVHIDSAGAKGAAVKRNDKFQLLPSYTQNKHSMEDPEIFQEWGAPKEGYNLTSNHVQGYCQKL